VSRKTLQIERPQQEHAGEFLNGLNCSSASELVTIAARTQAFSEARSPIKQTKATHYIPDDVQ